MSTYLQERVDAARRGLMRVHKSLIEVERLRYERAHGRIDSSGHLLQLVIRDPAFAWVRPLSALIVRMDTMLADDAQPVSAADVDALLAQARRLLHPDPNGEEFARQYDGAIQESADVVLAHGAALVLLEAVH